MHIDICFQYRIFFPLKWKQEYFLSNLFCGKAQFVVDNTLFFFFCLILLGTKMVKSSQNQVRTRFGPR